MAPIHNYLDNVDPLMDRNNEFMKEIEKMIALGLSRNQAGCYISNYHDGYICDIYNNGCKLKDKCEIASDYLNKI
jgi:hypothetical protein